MNSHIDMFDHTTKLYVRIKKSNEGWDRMVSKTKKVWKLTHKALSMDEVLRFKEEIVNNNFRNLYGVISKK
jgi:hypothetical protein